MEEKIKKVVFVLLAAINAAMAASFEAARQARIEARLDRQRQTIKKMAMASLTPTEWALAGRISGYLECPEVAFQGWWQSLAHNWACRTALDSEGNFRDPSESQEVADALAWLGFPSQAAYATSMEVLWAIHRAMAYVKAGHEGWIVPSGGCE